MVLTQFPHYVSVPEAAIIYLISLTIILIHSDFCAITDTSAVSRLFVCIPADKFSEGGCRISGNVYL